MCRSLTIGVVPIGKARIARAGNHVTIVSFGIGMTYAMGAAEKLATEGIEAEVVDLRTIRPMDIADCCREREEDQSLCLCRKKVFRNSR